jgi:hypothetical protein
MTMQESEQSIFLRAIEMPTPEERERYLDETCGDDASLRSVVEALLAARERLARAASARAVSSEPTTDVGLDGQFGAEDGPGVRVGPYKILVRSWR